MIFANLDIENSLQIQDKTRLSGVNSYAIVGATAVTDVTIKPGANGLASSVFNSDSNNWYLDYQFNTFEGDFDSTNNKLDFNEGGVELNATITAATYTLATLATEMQTQLNAVGAFTYVVSVDKDDKFTISADGNFSLLPNEGSNSDNSILPIIGISSKPGFTDSNFANKITITSDMVRSLPKQITLTIINAVDPNSTEVKYMDLYSISGDALFSNDANLRVHKSDLMRWVEAGRNSFLKYHRAAQVEIIDYLRDSGYIDINGDPMAVVNLTNPKDLEKWSRYVALRLIFDDLSNSLGDIFDDDARGFESKELRHRNLSFIRSDVDNDGIADVGEGLRVRSGRLIRQ